MLITLYSSWIVRWSQNLHWSSSKRIETEEINKSQKRKKRFNCPESYCRWKKTCLYMSIYSSALQVMRKYIKNFQQAEPAIFRIYTEQVDVFTEFLTNFIKPEVLFECNRIRKLKTVDFSSTENHLLNNLLSVGSIACKIKNKTRCKF